MERAGCAGERSVLMRGPDVDASQESMGAFGFETHDTPRGKIKNWQGFTCPSCGGSMRTRSTGRANAGKYVVRTKECTDCGIKGITAEVWIPALVGSTSVETFDEEQRFAKRERRRAKSGYHGVGCGHPTTPRTLGVSVGRVFGGQPLCDHHP